MKGLRATLLLVCLVSPAHAVSADPAKPVFALGAANDQVGRMLRGSLAELSEVRQEIAERKIPISRATLQLQQKVLGLRRRRQALLAQKESGSAEMAALKQQLDAMRSQKQFISSRLAEFVRDFEARIDMSELPQFERLTATAKRTASDAERHPEAAWSKQLGVVSAAIDRLGDRLGGRIFEGEALGPDGVLREGRFVSIGPSVFFSSFDHSVTGLVENRANAADPVVVALPARFGEGIAAVAESGRGSLPFDSTLGKALKKQRSGKTVGQYVAEGGPVGYVILGLGSMAFAIMLFKWVEIGRFRVTKPPVVDAIVSELARGSQAGAAKLSAEVDGMGGEILRTGVEHAAAPRSILEDLLFEKILDARPLLERYLPFLAVTAAASPLLGLLGTVIGMIKTFQLITLFGTGDAKSLSSGISEALVTTALGLIVAIPVLLGHGALVRMARQRLGQLEQLIVAFINGAKADETVEPNSVAQIGPIDVSAQPPLLREDD